MALSVGHAADDSGDGDPGDKAFYGKDDRVEIGAALPSLQRAASAVVALFPGTAVTPVGPDRWRLHAGPTGLERGWCPDERFAGQSGGVRCTGFLIAPDRIATAAHCIEAPDDPGGGGLACAEARFVFDHRLGNEGTLPTTVAADQVYRCREVADGEDSATGADWRVVWLDRAVLRDPLTVYVGEPLEPGTPLAVIGHPSGLPMKAARNGSLVRDDVRGYFVTDVDAYEGSSGSPVLAEFGDSRIVVGLLSRGAPDFEPEASGAECRRSRRCDLESCRGEHVTHASVLDRWATSRWPARHGRDEEEGGGRDRHRGDSLTGVAARPASVSAEQAR